MVIIMFLKFEPKYRHLYQYGHQINMVIRSRLFISSADTDPTYVTEDMFHGVVATLYHKFNWGSIKFQNQDLKQLDLKTKDRLNFWASHAFEQILL